MRVILRCAPRGPGTPPGTVRRGARPTPTTARRNVPAASPPRIGLLEIHARRVGALHAERVTPSIELAPEHGKRICLLTVLATAQMGAHTANVLGQGAMLDRDIGEDSVGLGNHLGCVRVGLAWSMPFISSKWGTVQRAPACDRRGKAIERQLGIESQRAGIAPPHRIPKFTRCGSHRQMDRQHRRTVRRLPPEFVMKALAFIANPAPEYRRTDAEPRRICGSWAMAEGIGHVALTHTTAQSLAVRVPIKRLRISASGLTRYSSARAYHGPITSRPPRTRRSTSPRRSGRIAR